MQSAERSGDYIYAVLTDETPPLDAAARLRSVYPNLARLEFDLANRPARQARGRTRPPWRAAPPPTCLRNFMSRCTAGPFRRRSRPCWNGRWNGRGQP